MEGSWARVAGLDQPGIIRGNGAQILYEMRGSEFSTGGPRAGMPVCPGVLGEGSGAMGLMDTPVVVPSR